MRLKVLIDFVDITTKEKRTAGDVFEAEKSRGEQLLADSRRLVELAEPAEEEKPDPEEKEAEEKAPEEPTPEKKPAKGKRKK